MRKDYIRRVRNFHKDFVKDVLGTLIRINKKDGKAYPLRVHKSVSKRWKVPRYKVTLVLNYFEYLGFLRCKLESVDEFKERMSKYPGLLEKGLRRKYFYPNPDLPSNHIGKYTTYTKLTYDDLGKQYVRITEYPA